MPDLDKDAILRALYFKLKEDLERQSPYPPPVGIMGLTDLGRGVEIPRRVGRNMLNKAAAFDAFLKAFPEDYDKEAILSALREMHPFDLSDFQEALDNLEELIIQVRGEKTVTVEDLEGETRYFPGGE